MLYPLVNNQAKFHMAVPATDMFDVTLEWMRQELSDGCQYAFEYFKRDYDNDIDYESDDYYDDGDQGYGHTYW